ncbi:hypothetical protein [Halostagnicola kamekurae]|nr:hypothetical protein [Halostagnicola kamekurae]
MVVELVVPFAILFVTAVLATYLGCRLALRDFYDENLGDEAKE